MTDTDMLYMASLEKRNAELEAKVAELESKHWNECRQIAHYSDKLRRAKVLLRLALNDMNDEKDCGICEHNSDGQCPIFKEGCKFEWTHEAEALALIGEDANVPASADDTNVGDKIDSWISCKDKMPDDNELVLFCYVGESGIKSVHYGYHQTVRGLGSSWGKISGGWRYCNDDVTHWMPIPEPPKDGEQNV